MTNQFNLCKHCVYLNNCVLTNQKEKVWSCSEFDERPETEPDKKIQHTPKKEAALKSELEMAV